MASAISFARRIYNVANPPTATSQNPIKFGILGAARIAPPALVLPARSHPDTVVHAVAARDLGRAQTFAKKYGISKAYGGPDAYQSLLDDPEVDAVYNPLPNGLHYEWTMKALLAGKHVLLEKPSSNSVEETKKMFKLAEKKGLVLLEAFHYRFHPAAQRLKDIVDSGELGAIKSVEAKLNIPKGFVSDDDIRYNFDLGGGALMDCGCYAINSIRYITGGTPTSIINAQPSVAPSNFQIDAGTVATVAFTSTDTKPNLGNITATLSCHLSYPRKYGILPDLSGLQTKVICEGGEAVLFNFPLPTLYHYIEVTTYGGNSGTSGGGAGKGKGKKRVEKVYKFRDFPKGHRMAMLPGEDWWTTYRYQLEAFVDKIKERTPQTWITAQDSINNMKTIEMIYEKAGLVARPLSTYVAPEGAL